MELLKNQRYIEALREFHKRFPLWGELDGKRILISGATGLLGSFLIDAVMLRNESLPAEERCHVIGLGRNRVTAEKRFAPWFVREEFSFISHDIVKPLPQGEEPVNYLIHAASPSDPVAFATEPINTICASILGTQNMLECSLHQSGARLLLCSSGEIYGENRGDVDYFDEKYCGYLNCNTLRAGYPEGKRVSEALCQAYIEEKGADAVIVRLPRCYGPTMRTADSKAMAQFIKKAVAGEDIVLKSEGKQLFSFLYVADAVSAILWVLLHGKTGEAYNVANAGSDITLRELAGTLAVQAGTVVCFDEPEEMERKGYSTATKALLNAEKLKALGWQPEYDIQAGLARTMEILRAEK